MNKKLIAVAVASAVGAPALALAQASTVQIYGGVRADYVYMDAGAGMLKRDRLQRYDSGIGIKGEEKLGGGLSAWFQLESTAGIEGSGITSGASGAWNDRNSAVGLKGAFGNVFFGHWDMPYKLTHGAEYRPFSTAGPFGVGAIMHNETAGNTDNITNVASFSRRQGQSVSYHSPTWNGFNFRAAFSTASETVNNLLVTNTTVAATAAKPRLWSVGATYASGPLYIGAGYERHRNYNPAAQAAYIGGDDRAWDIAAAYTFAGQFRVGAIYESIEYDLAAGQNLEKDSWGLTGAWKMGGPHELRVGYFRAKDTKGNSLGVNVNSFAAPLTAAGAVNPGTGADMWMIQYANRLSKRTEVNIGYSKLGNDLNARYRINGFVRNTCQGALAGCSRDQDAFAVGINHKF